MVKKNYKTSLRDKNFSEWWDSLEIFGLKGGIFGLNYLVALLSYYGKTPGKLFRAMSRRLQVVSKVLIYSACSQ